MFFTPNKKKRYLTPVNKSIVSTNLKPIDYFTDNELWNLPTTYNFVYDIEVYSNFVYIAFKCIKNNKVVTFELSNSSSINIMKLQWLVNTFCIIGFNNIKYDNIILLFVLQEFSTEGIKAISDDMIKRGVRPYEIIESFKLKPLQFNNIDLIEICPLSASLKTYAGRLHCQRMQDLPIDPDKILTENDAEIIRHYCINDLDNTILIYNELLEQIELRKNMSFKYQRDLRSKSDAQIAESVIISEITKLRKYKPKKPMVDFNARLVYNKPSYIVFNSTLLNSIVTNICNSTFNLDINGSPILPAAIKDLKIRIGKTDYQLGFGGLHSKEKSISYVANDQYRIIDRDVESFYPRMILNQELYPQHLGTQFLDIFNEITETRVNAKRTKDTVTADSLKIVINGCFGKFGSSYSMVYSPNLMIQTTISGQLSLLMLIEAIENIGISVISANTDGIVIHCPRNRYDELNEIIKQWETKCSFKTEETEYIALYSRDINNYIAIKMDGAYKTKGAYLNPYNDKKLAIFRFHKNPETTICIEAVCNYLTGKSEIAHTIQSCQDIRKFVSIKNVKGGGQKNGVYLGKVIRWYYANNTHGEISYVGSGNKVSKTDGGKPLMDLPNKLPDDINYDWYISNCYDILEDIGFYHKPMIGD